ncbi:MAG: FlgD immunoglobulin-like domain containing protein [Candidatus Latescibacterota bacterium]|nr:FlgD immunoglobulin-like domain containing protein [Candidatus Latescibacterota bacterium]
METGPCRWTRGPYIYELLPSQPLDFAGYQTLRFAFYPGDADGGGRPAFSILANEDPRALVKLIDGDLQGVRVDLNRRQWQVVEVPLTAFSWLESPLTSLRFFGTLRGTFYLDAIELVADRHFPFQVTWTGAVPDSVRPGDVIDLDLAARLQGGGDVAATLLTADLSDLGGTSGVPLRLDAEGVHRLRTGLEVTRDDNGLANVRIDIGYTDGERSWQIGFDRAVVVPCTDIIIYDDDLKPDWREVTATSVDIDPASDAVVYSGSRAMSWRANNLIVEYETDRPVEPVGFDALRLHVHPGTAVPGRLGAFSVMFNGDSRNVVRLLGETGGLDIELRQWQQIDIPLSDLRLQEPIRTVRIFGDFTGTLYVDDVRFVAATVAAPQTAVTQDPVVDPGSFALGDAWPNPFNSSTVIPFRLQGSAHVELVVFDLLGQRVATLVSGWRDASSHRSTWNGRTDAGAAAASGVYLYRLHASGAGQSLATGKLLLLR